MQTEAHETENNLQQTHYDVLNKLVGEYANSLQAAGRMAVVLDALFHDMSHTKLGELHDIMRFCEAAKKINLMLNELQANIAKLNGVLQ